MATFMSNGRRRALTAAALTALFVAANADAKAKVVEDIRVEVDGKPFKVVRYDDGTVMVVQRTMGGHRFNQEFRDRSRRAVEKATGCALVDELLDPFNIHYTGRLQCPAGPPLMVGIGDRP